MYRLNEIGNTPKGQYALGQVYARANKRRSGITDAWSKRMPKKKYYTAAEYYPKGTKKYDDIMHDAKSEAECPPNRKVNMKPVVYNDKGYETTNFGLGIMDYEKSHKTNESKQYTNMNKKLIRLTEGDLHKIVKESVNRVLREGEYNFASGTGNYDVNSDEWKTNYDRMSNDYRGQERKSNSNLMDLQIAHHNGMKGRGDYNGELPKTKQMYPKGKAESIDTIISSGLRRVNGGISPSEAFSDFKPFSEEEKQYYSDDMISQYYIPIGTVYGDTFMLIYDTKKGKYIVPKEPIEL